MMLRQGLDAASVNVQLDAWGHDSIRIRVSPSDIQQIPDVQAMLPFPPGLTPPKESPCAASRNELTNGNMAVGLGSDGTITAKRLSDGATLMHTTSLSFQEVTFESIYPSNYSLYATSLSYTHLHGLIYGLGEHKTNRTTYDDYFHLFENSQNYDLSSGGDITMPFYVSTAGFGFLYNQAGYGSIGITRDNATWTSNATHQLDLWITVAPAKSGDPTPYPGISSNYADVTGHPNPLPHFASGFWQSKDRYRNQSELLEVAKHLHDLRVPVQVLVIDWQHWQYLGDWQFWKAECWPDPTAMVKQISSYGMHTMISAWPRVDLNSIHYKEMSRLKYLTTAANGSEVLTDDHCIIYDAFNPAAREYVWKALLEGYVSHGIQLFWLDAAEPERSRPGLQWWGGKSDREVGMAWVIKHQQMIYEGALSSGIPRDDTIMLSRHGWIGSNLFNAFVWSGDLTSTWDNLLIQVKLAPNVQLSGLHWWATDIGGYSEGKWQDPDFGELLLRWFQWGAFLPLFRVHGHRSPDEEASLCGISGGPNELWTYLYQEEIASVIALRESIRPYVEYHLLQASLTGVPILQVIHSLDHSSSQGWPSDELAFTLACFCVVLPHVQPMWYNFTDSECLEESAETQYMFGPRYLVAPVTQRNATSRSVYLPQLPSSEQWVHFFSGQTYQGGQRVVVKVTLADFPLFQRLPKAMNVEVEDHEEEDKLAIEEVLETALCEHQPCVPVGRWRESRD
jgi:alpha-D-xyloside xylohydrolase